MLLQNLYRLRGLGFEYIDSLSVNRSQDDTLPNNLEQLHKTIFSCHLCDLSKSRTQSMPGYGNQNAEIFFVNGSVLELEDAQNNYYAANTGKTLQKMIQNVLGLSIEEVYITYALKCKPANSQRNLTAEQQSCHEYLLKQIELVKPKIVVALGEDAYKALSPVENNFEAMRGHLIDLQQYKLVPIYHPSYLLRNPSLKKETMNDLELIKSLL
jgi:uracil-DNA glycosylase